MKRAICILFLFFIAIGAYSQERFIIGGSISVLTRGGNTKDDNMKTDKQNRLNYRVLPSFHYMVSDHVAIGTSIGYGGSRIEKSGTSDSKLYTTEGRFIFEPSVIYYLSLGEKFSYSPMGFVDIEVGKRKDDITTRKQNETSLTSFEVGLRLVRFEFRPVSRVGITFSCGEIAYRSIQEKVDNKSSNTDSGFDFNLNITPTLGVLYYF